MSKMADLDIIKQTQEPITLSSEKDGAWILDSAGQKINIKPFLSMAQARRFCFTCGLNLKGNKK